MHLSSEFPTPDLDESLNDTELLPEVAAERELETSALNDSHRRDEQSLRSREPTFSSEGGSGPHDDSPKN